MVNLLLCSSPMNSTAPIENSSATAHTPRLVLVDGSGYIFRAYHAIRPLSRPDGTPVNAVYGFTTMLMKLRETYNRDYLVVIFDASRQSFRSEIFADYKANRSETPADLIPQFPLVRDATRAMHIPAIELENYEADDLIASYAEAAHAQGLETIIISSDKDLMQLVHDGSISMFDPMKERKITSAEVVEKFGVGPELVVEVQSLIGDAVDNVPGVPGIGQKTAAELILQFGTLENLLANAHDIKQPKRRESLLNHADAARLSRQLVQLKRDIPLPVPLIDLAVKPLDRQVLSAFLTAQNFNSLAKKVAGGVSPAAEKESRVQRSEFSENAPPVTRHPPLATHYETIADEAALMRWIDEARRVGVVAVDTETTSLNAVDASLVGVSLATAAGKACYIPVGHVMAASMLPSQTNLFGDALPSPQHPAPSAQRVLGQLSLVRVLELLSPLLTDDSVLKVGHNLKYDLVVLMKYGVDIHPLADTMLMSYCLGGGLHTHGLDFLAMRHFGHAMISFAQVTGTGKSQKNFSEIEIEPATKYAAEDADFTLRLYEALSPQLAAQGVQRIYDTVERPLVPVIARMEAAGIAIDVPALQRLSAEFGKILAGLEEEIIALAGMPFSVASPKQLGEVLFDKLQLPGGKKSTKSGAYTTDAGTLETLAEQGYEIAKKLLEWRHYSKLKSTYTDALPKVISPSDGRVHTHYSMVGASTGRLSSSDPNLQNIPIRSDEGKRIRETFIAPVGSQLISADYSQIELRLLAHMADIPVLKEAFKNGADIHAVTASEMFGVPLDQVTSELRRRAKSINFGIIYGISAHGLSVQLGISRADAADYIARYFAQYPGIREYMDRTVEFARTHAYVETLYGRRVHVRDINSQNGALRQFSERAAINAPLQGTAADIIKKAMVAVERVIASRQSSVANEGSGARLLLQVHDELIIEAPTPDCATLIPRIKHAMEQVANLSVPLTVEVGVGQHWGAAH